jgi:predicted Rossmann-fold nucleotide-binding protein
MIQPVRVLVAGASRLPKEFAPFAKQLGRALMRDSNFVLVTGGMKKRDGHTLATDFVAADAALAALKQINEPSNSRIMTLLPESEVTTVERFRLGKMLQIRHTNPHNRRFSMVLTSTAVVTIHGDQGTAEIIDLAYAAGKVLLPIPATGGKSRERWDEYEEELCSRLRATPADIAHLKDASDPQKSIGTCVSLLRQVLRPKCFLAMAFANHPMANTYETIRSVLETKGYHPVRIDQEAFSGNIVEAIWDAIRATDIAVVDLTNQKPNVYYELGICHALNKFTVLTVFSPDGEVPEDIPFDIKVQRILPYGTAGSLRAHLEKTVPEATTSGDRAFGR